MCSKIKAVRHLCNAIGVKDKRVLGPKVVETGRAGGRRKVEA